MTDSTTDGDVLTIERCWTGLAPLLLPRLLLSPSLELKDEFMLGAITMAVAPTAVDDVGVCCCWWASCNLRVCFLRSKLRQNPLPQMRHVNC